MDEEPLARDPTRVVVAAYLLAAVCALVPVAVVGALFAAAALWRRNRPGAAAGVAALSLAATASGIALR